MEGPTFVAVIASCLGAVEWSGALSSIELAEVAAAERRPDDTVLVDVGTTNAEARQRYLKDLAHRRLRRIVAELYPDHVAREPEAARAPDHIVVGRVWHDRVETCLNAGVHRRVDRLTRLGPSVLLTVAVRVENHWCPTLRCSLVPGTPILVRIDPSDRVSARAAEVERVLLVIGELQVMCAEARIEELVLPCVRQIDRGLSPGAFDREELRGRMIRSCLAEIRCVRSADSGGIPDATLLVEHRIVCIGFAVPDTLLAPVR